MSVPAPRGGSVDDWLDWQLQLHASEMELGLDRVARVAAALGLLPLAARSVVVAGTNGKGSCVALLESLLGGHGRVGSYTSPHLYRYNERIRIDGDCVDDASLCAAFAAVEDARGDVSLTYFEYGTLAALWLFARAGVDFAVLEVGLGGRLDAVNIVDADVALITNIGLDHMDWLGPDRETIGAEKAGVLRADRPAVCADRDMPASIAARARTLGCDLARIGRDYDIAAEDDGWRYRDGDAQYALAAHEAVVAENLAAALAVMQRLGLACEPAAIAAACERQAGLPGRRERLDGDVPVIFDVGHNAEAIALLVAQLQREPAAGRTHVVLGMLADKPVETVGRLLKTVADRWYPAGTDALSARGMDARTLAQRVGVDAAGHADPCSALAAARLESAPGDRIVVCGSFLTVADARRPALQ